MTRRVAVVGIDGSGKSELITALEAASPRDARAVSCPDFHGIADGPMHQTSRQLAALGAAADRTGNVAMKAASLYLRMTLFGVVEKFIVQTYEPQLLYCERHPVIETLVYAPSYERIAASMPPPTAEDVLRLLATADEAEPGTSSGVTRWQHVIAANSGVGNQLPTILDDVVSLLAQPLSASVMSLSDCYGTQLPDAVIWIDVPVDEAMARLKRRGKPLEIHENEQSLSQLRDRYATTLPALDLPVHRVDVLERVDVLASCQAFIATL